MIGLILRIIFLPITLLGVAIHSAFGLLGISTKIFLWPLKIFARHTVACLVIFAIVILVIALKREPHAADSLKPQIPAELTPAARQAAKGPVPIIQTVTKRENGDSKFATDLYKQMTDDERAAYSAQFFQGMNTTTDGQTHTWAHYNISGAIRIHSSFQNKLGSTCRTFSEVLKVHQIEQQLTGTACVKSDGSWCKLKPNATAACNLGREAGMFEGISRAVGDLF